jgi:hypothetical protein
MKSVISKQKLAVFVVSQIRAWAECYDVLSTLLKLSWLLALCLFAQVCLKFWGVRVTPESISTEIPQLVIAARNPL